MAGFIAVDTYLGIWQLIKEINGLVQYETNVCVVFGHIYWKKSNCN